MTTTVGISQMNKWKFATPIASFGLYLVLLIVLLHPTFFDMAMTWVSSSSYSHGILVAPAAVWMMSKRRRPISPAPSLIATGGVAIGLVLWLLGRAAGVALIEQIAFVTLIIAGFGAIFGLAALRAHIFPLAFLYFMAPFGESLLPFLQTLTANAAVALLNLVGEPTFLDGIMIETRSGLFEVAEACAGLRFLLAAIMLSAIYAYTSLPTWRLRLIFLAIAVVAALGANIIRAFLLVYIATITDMRLAVGADHYIIGLVFYGLVFVFLFWIGGRLARAPEQSTDHWTDVPKSVWNPVAITPALLLIIAASLYTKLIIEKTPQSRTLTSAATISAPGWRILPPPEIWTAQLPNADIKGGATYQHEDQAVYFSYGALAYDRHGAEIINYRNRSYDGDAWRKIAEVNEVAYLFGSSDARTFEILAGPDRRRLAVTSAYWWDGAIYTDKLALKRDQMFAKLQGRNPPGGVFFIAAPFSNNPDDAIASIRQFTTSLEPAERWLSRMERP